MKRVVRYCEVQTISKLNQSSNTNVIIILLHILYLYSQIFFVFFYWSRLKRLVAMVLLVLSRINKPICSELDLIILIGVTLTNFWLLTFFPLFIFSSPSFCISALHICVWFMCICMSLKHCFSFGRLVNVTANSQQPIFCAPSLFRNVVGREEKCACIWIFLFWEYYCLIMQ